MVNNVDVAVTAADSWTLKLHQAKWALKLFQVNFKRSILDASTSASQWLTNTILIYQAQTMMKMQSFLLPFNSSICSIRSFCTSVIDSIKSRTSICKPTSSFIRAKSANEMKEKIQHRSKLYFPLPQHENGEDDMKTILTN